MVINASMEIDRVISDPLESLRSRLKLEEAKLIKKVDEYALQLSQTPQTSLYKRHDLEKLKIPRDLR